SRPQGQPPPSAPLSAVNERTTMKRRAVTMALGAAALTLLATACGTTDEEPEANEPETIESETGGDCADVETSTGPVELTDSFGREISLDAPAERVAVLEWQQIEDVLALCVTPVA